MESDSYKVTVDGQPVFVHKFFTFNQFNWMDYARFSMTGKAKVEVTLLVSERRIHTAEVRPIAYGIKPEINGNRITFELDRPRYLVLFLNEYPSFYGTGLMLFAEPVQKNPPKLGDANVVNIQDYQVDGTGKAVETEKINKAIRDVSARDGGGVLFFPAGIYTTGTVMMKSNVRLYVDLGAVIRGSRKDADYTSASPQAGPRQSKAFFIIDNVENVALSGPGTIDMQGYPWLWHDFQPDTSEGNAREESGKVRDPRNGIRGYLINNSRNVSFQDLLLLRSAYWTINVFGSENFTTRNIKVVNRKQQYHDDAYDFRSSRHIRIEDGFAMTMDDTWAFYGGGGAGGTPAGVEDIVVKGFVNYTYTAGIAIGYGSAPAVKGLRFEDVHFVANHNKYAVWIQLTPAYFSGRGYASGTRFSRGANLEDFRFINCTFENDGGHIYIDGGEQSLTSFVFENCAFYAKPTRPSMLMGKSVGPVVFKNAKFNDSVIRNQEELERVNFDIQVPVKVER
jgi:polygalacturonase